MKQSKKSLGMKISAFVLSFAMVCTLLAGVNVVAFAADGDVQESLSVFRAYNPNNGEHLMTIDVPEYEANVARGYQAEGVAWKAPATSNTPIYRIYNPNSGEHMLTANAAECPAGWQAEGQKMYSDDAMGVPIYRVFNPNATDAGSHHYCGKEEATGLVARGWQWDNGGEPALYGVSDYASQVSIIDLNGLQTDGTGKAGDWLAVVFGSNFGTPKSVAWYKNGGVVKVITDDITDAALRLQTVDGDPILGAGEYYAVVENTKGQTYTSNSIVITEEGVAVMSEFSITDAYTALDEAHPLRVDVDNKTNLSVVNVTLNKDYNGNFYLVDNKFTGYSDVSGAKFDVTEGTNVRKVTKESDFTDTKLMEAATTEALKTLIDQTTEVYDTTANTKGTAINGLKYVTPEGTVHYKFLSNIAKDGDGNGGMKRGDKYYLVFDQDNNEKVKTGTEKTAWNVTEEVECPYVIAPDTLVVTDTQSSTTDMGWTATASALGGLVKAEYINGAYLSDMSHAGANAEIEINIYGTNEKEAANGDKFTSGLAQTTGGACNGAKMIVGGVGQKGCSAFCATAPSYTYVYAELTAPKGIFGKDKLTVTSPLVTTPDKVVESAKFDYEPENGTDMGVELSKARAAGTAYIVKTANIAKFDPAKSTTYEGSVEFAKGDTDVVIEDVFDNDDLGTEYTLAIVPDDSTDYASNKNADTFTLTAVENDYKLTGTTTGLTCETAGAIKVFNNTVLETKNQFGEDMAGTVVGGGTGTANAAMEFVKGSNASVDNHMTIGIGNDGKMGVQYTGTGVFVKGDTYKFELKEGKVLTVKCTEAGTGENAKWSVSITAS